MRKESGFTLVELVIVIAIIAILASIAVPNVLNWLPRYRLKSAGRDLHSNFQKAKMEAMKRNANVVLDFNQGNDTYRIFVDDGAGNPANAGNFAWDAGEDILSPGPPGNPQWSYNLAQSPVPQKQKNYHGQVTLNSVAFSGPTTQAGFNGRGMPASSRIGNVVLRKNNQGTNPLFYRIVLSIAGHIRTERSSDGINWQ